MATAREAVMQSSYKGVSRLIREHFFERDGGCQVTNIFPDEFHRVIFSNVP